MCLIYSEGIHFIKFLIVFLLLSCLFVVVVVGVGMGGIQPRTRKRRGKFIFSFLPGDYIMKKQNQQKRTGSEEVWLSFYITSSGKASLRNNI